MSTILRTRKQKLKELRKAKIRARRQKIAIVTAAGTIAALTLMGSKTGACACSTEYTVKKGDTLYSLSRKYQVSINQLMEANGLNSEKLYVNQQLLVPDYPLIHPEDYNDHDGQAGLYTIKKGDTLYSLSKKYQISVNLLMVANDLTSEKIKAGQQLLVPYEIPSPSEQNSSNYYTVQKGDTLFSIAKTYGVNVNELKKENNLLSNRIFVGQKISVPFELHTEEIEAMYSVAPGDTLWGIASRFGITIEDLKAKNSLHNDIVLIGQQLHIPGTAFYTSAEVVGAADSFTVEFAENRRTFTLSVPYGTASDFQKISGYKGTLVYKNNALIAFN